ncbi:hypothetical protein M5689_007231 [Euphorbia peplus]|nr:hypothetical protein M5689_007231 [Euphorbia peplus]
MATLHKFKLLASQCAVIAGTPTQSPTTSPVFHLRRRKTLRMFLSRNSSDHRRRLPPDPPKDPPQKKRGGRRKLKDLFVSSSPPFEDHKDEHRNHHPDGDLDEDDDLLPVSGNSRAGNGGLITRRGAGLRSLSGTFRYRLLRRSWRPVLITIPE